MSKMQRIRPIALASSIALAGSFAAASVAQADTSVSPFMMTPLTTPFAQAAGEEGSCGEGACGEGSCGGDDKGGHAHGEDTEGACGEGNCGEGSCGEGKGSHSHPEEESSEA